MNIVPPEKWYQEAIINGIEMPTRRKTDTNEKRWKTFIEPLLPFKGENRTFIDLGCNAGFYCRKMSDLGFKATGVEKDIIPIRHATYWESCEPKGVKIIRQDINKYEIPTASIVLLANVHYWLTPKELKELVNKLKEKAIYVLLIGRHKPVKTHKSLCDFDTLKKVFKGWDLRESIVPKGQKHFSVLFKNSNLVEKDVEEIFHHQQLAKSKKFLPAYTDLVKTISNGNGVDLKETKYWDYLTWRKFKSPERLMNRHVKLIGSMIDNGIIEPLIIGRVEGFEYNENRLTDGDHRYIIARELGIKKLICKVVGEK